MGTLPYVVLMMLGLIVLLPVPQLATWLPRIAGFGW